jgi:hypothetical protein
MSGVTFLVKGGNPPGDLPDVGLKDRILTHGSLVLYDPSHSVHPMASGLVNNQQVPNVAWEEAAALLGSGTLSSLSGSFGLGAGNGSGSVLAQRTGRGAIHVIMSQTNQTLNTQGAFITLSDPIRAYLAANPNNDYFISRWITKTRVALTGGPSEGSLYTNGVSSVGNSLYQILPSGLSGTFSATDVTPSINTAANIYFGAATTEWSGNKPGTLSASGHPVVWGQMVGSYQTSSFNNKSSSYVLQRFYMEDLTASGRTFAQVNKISKDFWARDMAAGGRYTGDTYTAPATLP